MAHSISATNYSLNPDLACGWTGQGEQFSCSLLEIFVGILFRFSFWLPAYTKYGRILVIPSVVEESPARWAIAVIFANGAGILHFVQNDTRLSLYPYLVLDH